MNVQQLIAQFEAGVRYACGCEERGLHPAIVKALETGAVSMAALLRCPSHLTPMLTTAEPQ
jgi:hypothetical protein